MRQFRRDFRPRSMPARYLSHQGYGLRRGFFGTWGDMPTDPPAYSMRLDPLFRSTALLLPTKRRSAVRDPKRLSGRPEQRSLRMYGSGRLRGGDVLLRYPQPPVPLYVSVRCGSIRADLPNGRRLRFFHYRRLDRPASLRGSQWLELSWIIESM